MSEAVARAIASALGDNYDDAFASKAEWTAERGDRGGRFRDINEPFRCDYDAAAHAALTAAQAEIEALRAERADALAKVEKLREALHDAICMIGHAMPMDTTVLAGRRLVALEVWQTGYDLLHPKPKKESA